MDFAQLCINLISFKGAGFILLLFLFLFFFSLYLCVNIMDTGAFGDLRFLQAFNSDVLIQIFTDSNCWTPKCWEIKPS